MRPAPMPSSRFTLPCPHFGNRQSSFGHSLNGSSRIDWNASKFWPHFRQEYSYVGIRNRWEVCLKRVGIQLPGRCAITNHEWTRINTNLWDSLETAFPIRVHSCLLVVDHEIRSEGNRGTVSELDANQR